MGSELPVIDRERFLERVAEVSPIPLASDAGDRVYAHYQELRRWNPRLSLIGPGDREHLVERHYGESLAALGWLATGARVVVDVGSGGGFPGLILAAARPELEVYLVEPRQRKWSFLESAAARCALSVRCLNARVGASLPDGLPDALDVVTVRALKLDQRAFEALAARMPEGSQLLLWRGQGEASLPSGFEPSRRLRFPASDRRFLVEYLRTAEGADKPKIEA